MPPDNIVPGDVVVIIRDCCGTWLGRVFTVSRIIHPSECASITCRKCGWIDFDLTLVESNDYTGHPYSVWACPIKWVKKFPPPSEVIKHDTPTEEKIDEVA